MSVLAQLHLFVYGTLMRGEINHRFLRLCRRLGDARTEPGFELADLGTFPALVATGSGVVVGELYEVDEATLRRLDSFEDVPNLYVRRAIRVLGPAGREWLAFAYLMPASAVAGCPRIASGSWRTPRPATSAGPATEL